MSNIFKRNMILIYLTFSYVYVLIGYLYFIIFLTLFNVYYFYKLHKNNKIIFSLVLKSILFGIFIFYFIIFDRLVIGIFLCGMDGVGYLQRSGIIDYNYSCSSFTFYEYLLFNLVSSLYYPIYIFIFFKPFVNHLDKSIRKRKENK